MLELSLFTVEVEGVLLVCLHRTYQSDRAQKVALVSQLLTNVQQVSGILT